jgi:hypothetical protein
MLGVMGMVTGVIIKGLVGINGEGNIMLSSGILSPVITVGVSMLGVGGVFSMGLPMSYVASISDTVGEQFMGANGGDV